jgi:NAD(P)-dependent dehydrogenase (short-subunit alcohol dehydrogenase family)
MTIRDVEGLVAVVTGGSSGIGLATARLLQSRGARVAVLDRQPPVDSTALLYVAADVTDDDSVRAAIATVVDRLGGLDILVNNAGIGAAGTVEDNDIEEWQRVFDVNLLGLVRVTRAALPHLRRSSSAAIVNTCSVVATAGLPSRALYSATKGAVLSLTLAMAADHVREGIRVNAPTPASRTRRGWNGSCPPLLTRWPSGPRSRRGSLWGALSRPTRWPAPSSSSRVRSPARDHGQSLAVDGGMAGCACVRRRRSALSRVARSARVKNPL